MDTQRAQVQVLSVLLCVVVARELWSGFGVLAIPVCEKTYFTCFRDCCQKGEFFCNEAPQQERCQSCESRQQQCGTNDAHQNCLLYCAQHLQRNSTTTTPLSSTATPPTSTDLHPTPSAAETTANISLTAALVIVFFGVFGILVFCVCKKCLPQSWTQWLKDRSAMFSRAGQVRPRAKSPLPEEQGSSTADNSNSALLNPTATNANLQQTDNDDDQTRLISANPIEDVDHTAIGQQPDLVENREPARVSAIPNRRAISDEEDRGSSASGQDDDRLSTRSDTTTASVHDAPRASARPPSGESDLSDVDSQSRQTRSSSQSSSPGGSLSRDQGRGKTNGKPGAIPVQPRCCANHPCSPTINNNITIGSHCNGCHGNECGKRASAGAPNGLLMDHDVSERRSGAVVNNTPLVPTAPPRSPCASPTNGPDAGSPMQPTDDPQCRDLRLYTTATPDTTREYCLAPTGQRADDQQMNVKRRPDDEPGMPVERPPPHPNP